jgi:GWxTD domain-containing protein
MRLNEFYVVLLNKFFGCMKFNYKVSVLVYLLIPLSLFAQNSERRGFNKLPYGVDIEHRPTVNYTVFVDYNDTTYNPVVYISFSIQNDVILFERDGNKYEGGVQLIASIMKDDMVVAKETWTEKIVLDDFKKTNSKEYQLFIHKFKHVERVGDGEDYKCVISVMDVVTRKLFIDKRDFKIRKMADDKDIIPSTSLIFLLKKPSSEFRVPLNPNDSILDYGKEYWGYFRLLEDINDSLKVNIRIYKAFGGDLKLFKQMYKTVYGDSVVLEIPTLELPEGAYKLSLNGQYKDKFFKTEKMFSIIWYEKPIYLYTFELALEPLVLLLDTNESERVFDMDEEDQKEWLDSYWKSKDPTPNTDFNEIKFIFYKRVDDANEKYSQKFKKGWQTDRGKILILYGEPYEIIDNRTTIDKPPYIIWKYNKGIEKFTFTDEDRDGEYILYKGNGG